MHCKKNIYKFFLFFLLILCANGYRAEFQVATADELKTSPMASPAKKDEGTKTKILMLGDSLTEGQGVQKNNAYPFLVEQKLYKKGFTSVKVINAGISGSTSASALSRLKWHLQDNPDILLLALGANDGLRGLSTANMKNNLAATIELALRNGLKVVLAGMEMPPNYGRAYTKDFRNVFHQLAKEYNLIFIPFLLEGVGGNPSLNQPDGIHPNKRGHEIIADLLCEALEKVL